MSRRPCRFTLLLLPLLCIPAPLVASNDGCDSGDPVVFAHRCDLFACDLIPFVVFECLSILETPCTGVSEIRWETCKPFYAYLKSGFELLKISRAG